MRPAPPTIADLQSQGVRGARAFFLNRACQRCGVIPFERYAASQRFPLFSLEGPAASSVRHAARATFISCRTDRGIEHDLRLICMAEGPMARLDLVETPGRSISRRAGLPASKKRRDVAASLRCP